MYVHIYVHAQTRSLRRVSPHPGLTSAVGIANSEAVVHVSGEQESRSRRAAELESRRALWYSVMVYRRHSASE